MTAEYFETGSRKGRGRSQRSTDLIEAMRKIAEASAPITGRGVGYKLFTLGRIPSMKKADMARVYRLLREAREEGRIEWEWIVDETRQLEGKPSWDDPAQFARCTIRDYCRNYWNDQPLRTEVWSEKGTVREAARGPPGVVDASMASSKRFKASHLPGHCQRAPRSRTGNRACKRARREVSACGSG
jgi:hypothetical protein